MRPTAATDARAKLDGQLLTAVIRIERGESPSADRNSLDVDGEQRVLVDITATVSMDLLARIEALGGIVISHFAQYNAIRGRVPLGQLLALAASESIRTIRVADVAVTNAVEGRRP